MSGRLLLTGGGGMVGRNLLEHPDIVSWDVAAPTRGELDLSDFGATLQYVERFQPDVIVHAAGKVGGIQANIARPVDFLVSNLDIGRNIILAARQAGVRRLLNLASSCMFPRNAANPLAEDLILTGELEPTNEGYALAKIISTRLCSYISRETPDLAYKTFVPCNLYGRHDNFTPERSHLLPAIIHKVHVAKTAGHDTVEIWGDGTARREFMYAGDLADAIMRALANFDAVPDLMNIGPGADHSINDYYSAVADIVGWNGQFEHDLSKPVGMNRKLISTSRQESWGWKPSTSLQSGISKAYDFYLRMFN